MWDKVCGLSGRNYLTPVKCKNSTRVHFALPAGDPGIRGVRAISGRRRSNPAEGEATTARARYQITFCEVKYRVPRPVVGLTHLGVTIV